MLDMHVDDEMMTEELLEFYNKVFKFIADEIDNGTDERVLSPIFSLIAYKIYKSSLDQDEYDDMCKYIYDHRNDVEPFIQSFEGPLN